MDDILNNRYLYTITNTIEGNNISKEIIYQTSDTTTESRARLTCEQLTDWHITVHGMHYSKEMYKPNCLTLSLLIRPSSDSGSVTAAAICSRFTGGKVSVKVQRGQTDSEIIKDYLVMSVEPIRKPNMYFEAVLVAYSPDYLLTLDKYCQTYVNARLIDHVIKKHKLITDSTIGFDSTVDNLRFMRYQKDSASAKVELRLPYAVQYNESFYRFVSRLANRCGEFLYFENGNLHLGLPATLATHEISSATGSSAFKSFSYVNHQTSPIQVFGTHYDYSRQPEERMDPETFQYDVDYAADDYVWGLSRKNTADSAAEFMDWIGLTTTLVSYISGVKTEDYAHVKNGVWRTYVKALLDFGIAVFAELFSASATVKDINDNHKDALEASWSKNNSNYDAKEQELSEAIRAFSSALDIDTKKEQTLIAQTKALKEAKGEQAKLENEQKEYYQLAKASKAIKAAIEKAELMCRYFDKFPQVDTSFSTTFTESKNRAVELKGRLTRKSQVKYSNINNNEYTGSKDDIYRTDAIKTCCTDAQTAMDTLIAASRTNGKSLSDNDKTACQLAHRDMQSALYLLSGVFADYNKAKITPVIPDSFGNEVTNTNTTPTSATPLATTAERKDLVTNVTLLQNEIYKLVDEAKAAIKTTDDTYGSKFDASKSFSDIITPTKELKAKDADVATKTATVKDTYTSLITSNVFHMLYSTIEKAEDTISRERCKLEIDTEQYASVPCLGDQVTFDGQTYLVVKVESEVTECLTRTADYQEKLVLELIPSIVNPLDDKTTIWVPARSECREQPKVGAQVAKVVANQDPWAWGRLRIQFPWQGKDDKDASPWIRMATPYASSKDAGFFFVPAVGDEVLVDFYNGNIERPIIVGALNNAVNTRYWGKDNHKQRAIVNEWGQSISFNKTKAAFRDALKICPGDFSDVIMEGVSNTLNKPVQTFFDDTFVGEKLKGSIKMTDTLGSWEITGSTGGRSVSISSKFGKVKIDALTGISINAPMGDVSINAKNISMKASNNITIESGTQIKRQRELKKDSADWVSYTLDSAKDVVKSQITLATIDFSILRLLVEAVLPPVEGTLELKSNRYLKLEAGGKSAVDKTVKAMRTGKNTKPLGNNNAFNRRKQAVEDALLTSAFDFDRYTKVLNNIPGLVEDCIKGRKTKNDTYKDAKSAYEKLPALPGVAAAGGAPAQQPKYKTIADLKSVADLEALDVDALTDMAAIDRELTKIVDLDGASLDIAFPAPTETGEALNAAASAMLGTNYVAADTEDVKKDKMHKAQKKASLMKAKALFLAIKAFADEATTIDDAAKTFATDHAGDFYNYTDLVGNYAFNATAEPPLTPGGDRGGDIKTIVQDIYKFVVNAKDDNGGADIAKLEDKRFATSISRMAILKIVDKTDWYVYKANYGKQTYNSFKKAFSFLPKLKSIPQALAKVTIDDVPEDNYVSATYSNDYDFFYDADPTHAAEQATRDKEWKIFSRSCQFMVDDWANPEEKSHIAQGFGEITTLAGDLLGLTDIANNLFSTFWGAWEASTIKGSAHGGRILMADPNVAVALKKDYTFERISGGSPSKDWE